MLRKIVPVVVCMSMLTLPCGVTRAEIVIADSVIEFSGVQGENNWYYGYYNGPFVPDAFQQMPIFVTNVWYADNGLPDPFYYTRLSSIGGHPNGTITSHGRTPVEHWAVRRYVCEVNGLITIMGNIADRNPGGGNGIIGRIFVDGSEVYSAFIDNANVAGVDYSLNANVTIGSIIDFAIDPRNADDRWDDAQFTATITTVPEPSTIAMFSIVGLCAALVRWRKRRAFLKASQNFGPRCEARS